MFWTEEKLEQRLNELDGYRYRDLRPIGEWMFTPDLDKMNGARPPATPSCDATIQIGDRWKGRDLYVWLRQRVTIPSEWSEHTVVGRFDFGSTGPGHNSGFESLLYVNGAPYQGVDSNHIEVFMRQEWAGTEVDLCFRLWSGLEGGGIPQEQEHQIRKAELTVLDEAADDLYFTGRGVLNTVKVLEEHQPERFELLQSLDYAFKLIDWSKPGSEAFYDSIRQAAGALRESVASWEKTSQVAVQCIGHTHIDVAWLWRLTHTREKAARSFSTVLRLMEKYPEYVFLQTQPQLYEYIKEDYPDIYEDIKQRIKEGRWEAGGAMWLEADCNLTSGESLVRQILYGTRFLQQEFGVTCSYLWLPDVFGYSWALPQILKKANIDTFMTTKISWSQYNRMPHDTFIWRGIDGSEVLTHFVTTPEVPGSTVWWYTYNGLIEPYSVKGIWDTYRDKGLNRELLLSYGYGDGGGGVNRDMLEMRRRLNEIPGLPHVKTGRAGDYFARLQETVEKTDQYVHTWDGELYLEYHRGTYTSQAYNKRMNRKLEFLYRDAEWLQSLNGVVGAGWKEYPQQKLYKGWKTIMRNQFHDIIPGSSIPEVYEDTRREYAEAEVWGLEARKDAAEALTTVDPMAWTVWNNASYARTELVRIPAESGMESGHWIAANGRELDAVKLDDFWKVCVTDVPPAGGLTIRFEPSPLDMKEAQPKFTYECRKLTTPFYVLEWNEFGQLTHLYDRKAKREVIAEGTCGNVLQVFEDKPKMFDAWDIDLFYQEKQREIRQLESVALIENDAYSAVLRFEWRYMDSQIVQNLTVYADSRRIDFASRVDWREKQQLLKVAFPVQVRATEATYDIQFGNVKRPTHWNTSWDYARFETVAHQWVDLSERGFGVSLLNDCKYGHDIKDNIIRLTLIKSATYPDPNADQGLHQFTYSLFPHSGDWVADGTVREAASLNQPLTLLKGFAALSGKSMLQLDVDHVIVDTVKKAEDSDQVVIRLHEYTGARSNVILSSDFHIVSWQETDLLEQPIIPLQEGPHISFDIKPYEIKTFLIDMKP
ncbi:alpha-mannosidase [Paenibacillus sp. FSL K6-2524]|uniref:alpha-mannosidase n=1 Tax=Paenibacillus sp. FSL K6-2524 TaxID=2954516 RepID=UPI0030FBC7FC